MLPDIVLYKYMSNLDYPNPFGRVEKSSLDKQENLDHAQATLTNSIVYAKHATS